MLLEIWIQSKKMCSLINTTNCFLSKFNLLISMNFNNATIVWPVLLLWSDEDDEALLCEYVHYIMTRCVVVLFDFIICKLHFITLTRFDTANTRKRYFNGFMFHFSGFDIRIFEELHFSLADTAWTLITDVGQGD